MAKWIELTLSGNGAAVTINFDNVAAFLRYPGLNSTTIQLSGTTKEINVNETPQQISKSLNSR